MTYETSRAIKIWLRILEDTPVPIKLTGILDVQRIDGIYKLILSMPYYITSRLVETKDRLIHRVSKNDEEDLQIFMNDVLRPRLLALTTT